jgi:hypothetical protein
MADVIDFLEKLGTDATLHRAGTLDLEGVLGSANLPDAVRAALLGAGARLEDLLGARGRLCALIHAPDEDDDEETEEEPEDDDHEEPGPEQALAGQRAA